MVSKRCKLAGEFDVSVFFRCFCHDAMSYTVLIRDLEANVCRSVKVYCRSSEPFKSIFDTILRHLTNGPKSVSDVHVVKRDMFTYVVSLEDSIVQKGWLYNSHTVGWVPRWEVSFVPVDEALSDIFRSDMSSQCDPPVSPEETFASTTVPPGFGNGYARTWVNPFAPSTLHEALRMELVQKLKLPNFGLASSST